MLELDQGGNIAEPAFRLFRLCLQFLIFFAAVAAAQWGIRNFLLDRGGRAQRWRNWYTAISVVVILILLLLRGPFERLLTAVGDAIARVRPEPQSGWLGGMLVGVFYAIIATLILFLAM